MIVSKKSATDPRLQWFRDARLGMFIHFGLYALLGRGEHTLNVHNVPRREYEALMRRFNPRLFNANEWIDAAEEMGARYITITAKHLDGFVMYDSALTDYKITNTPFGRDLIGELVAACHRRRMRICLYYSRAEWHHRNYVHDRDAAYSLARPMPEQQPDWPKYMEYFIGQLKELCTQYGRIDGFWFDAYGPDMPGDPRPKQVYDMIKRLQPTAVINDRNEYGDFFTPERSVYGGMEGYMVEACQALGWEWGYVRDCPLYSAPYLIQCLARQVGLGGNYLLNFGPKPDGTLPADRVAIARLIGRWVRRNRAAIYRTESLPVKTRRYAQCEPELYATRRGRRAYLFLPEWPAMNSFRFEGLRARPQSARLVGYGGKLAVELVDGCAEVRGLPPTPPQLGANIVKLTFKTAPRPMQFKEPRPQPVRVPAQRSVRLPADFAEFRGYYRKGRRIRIRPEIGGFACDRPQPGAVVDQVLIDWCNPEQQAIWRVDCERAGDYAIAIEFRCPRRFAHSAYTIRAAGRMLAGVVPATPLIPEPQKRSAYPWAAGAQFRQQRVGILRLPKGITSITIQPQRILRMGHFADVREVRLIPVKASRP